MRDLPNDAPAFTSPVLCGDGAFADETLRRGGEDLGLTELDVEEVAGAERSVGPRAAGLPDAVFGDAEPARR